MRLLDYLYPPTCALCSTALVPVPGESSRELASLVLCDSCNDFSPLRPVPPSACSRCGEPSSNSKHSHCVLCTVLPLAPTRLWSAFAYEGTLEELLKLYKYGRKRGLGTALGRLLCAALRSEPDLLAELASPIIVPVPSAIAQLRSRGFHHLMPLARELARQTHFPLRHFALRSNGEREPQATLGPAARWKNIAHAFSVRAKDIRGRQVLLLDDVVTTGATLHTAAQALADAGAATVTAITLARSRQFVHHRMEAVFTQVS